MTSFSPSDLWTTWGWVMLHFLWSGSFVVLLIGFGRRLIASPSLRYGLDLGGFVLFIAIPFVLRAVYLTHGTHVGVAPLLPSAGSPVPLPLDLPTATAIHSLNEWNITLASLARWLPWVWFVGTPMVTLWMLMGLLGVRRWIRRSLPTDASMAIWIAGRRLSRKTGRALRIRLSRDVVTPVLIGVVRPTILFPLALANGLCASQLEMILLHELAHLRRLDNLVLLVQRSAECLFFFHPGVWLLSRWMQHDRELCCDNSVVRQTGRPKEYAKTLCALAARAQPTYRFSNGMAGGSLRHRIEQVLNAEDHVMLRSRQISCLWGLGLFLLMVTAAAPFAATLTQDHFEADPISAVQGEAIRAHCHQGSSRQPEEAVSPSVTHSVTDSVTDCRSCHTASDPVHEVKPGDTLPGIALRYYGHEDFHERIGNANEQLDPSRLCVGQRLRLPSGAESQKTRRLIEALNTTDLEKASERERQELRKALHRALQRLKVSSSSDTKTKPVASKEKRLIHAVVAHVDDEARYVVLNVGTEDGVEPDARLDVYRDDIYLGLVVITEVADDHAIAKIEVKAASARYMAAGDRATNGL